MDEDKKVIFIACGQREEREKELGEKISALVESYDNLKPFLAEDTHSFNALTSEIFENLNRCSGFIAILHQREKYNENPKLCNSSLWINQEIAIAAFLSLRDKKDVPVRVFIESSNDINVKIEGVLQYIIVNSIQFSKDEEVIKMVKEWLDKTKFSSRKEASDYLLRGKRLIKILSGYTGDLHTYRLDLEIANIGAKSIRDIYIEFYFPKGIPINESSHMRFDKFEPKEAELWDFFGFKLKNNIDKILPGKSEQIYCFDFVVNHDVYFDGHTHKNMIWKIFADDMSPISDMVPLEGPWGEGINF